MVGLFSSRRSTTGSYRPFAETLEDRSCPAAPSISMSVMTCGATEICIYGYVQDESPEGLTVTLSGKFTGSYVTDEYGSFTAYGEATGLGEVFAETTDNEDLTGTGSVMIENMEPRIAYFGAMHMGDNRWVFSGQVDDDWCEGETVTFGGLSSLQGLTATVDSMGCFSIVVDLQEGEVGTVSAVLTDWWGQKSDEAWYLVV